MIDDDEDDQHRQRDDDQQTLPGLLHVLVLAAPDDIVALGQLDMLLHRLAGVFHVGADIDILDVHVDPGGAAGSSRS